MYEGAGPGSGRSLLAATAAVGIVAATVLAPPLTSHIVPTIDPAAQLTAAASEIADTAALALAAEPTSIGDAIIGFYLTVEPWTQYGATLASWAVGWVPFLGLLAPQITFFYDLDEAVVRSLVFNTAYLLDGTVDLSQALSNIGSATSTAWHDFVDTQASWLHSLLPPPPPDSLADVSGLPGLLSPFDLGAPDLLSLPSLLP